MSRGAGLLLIVAVIAALFFAMTARADLWMESNSHDEEYPPYHVHAHVRAWAYVGGDQLCHYTSWSHTIGDTDVDEGEGYSYYKSQWHNTEWGWTDVDIIYNELTIDDEYAQLSDLTYCPF